MFSGRYILVLFSLLFLLQCTISKPHNTERKNNSHHKKLKHKKVRKFFFPFHDGTDTEDVTSQINHRQNKISYFINQNELPLYERKFETIKDLGAEVECKLRGDCQGIRREDIPDGLAPPEQENEQRQLMAMAENQIHERLQPFGRGGGGNMPSEMNPQFMPDMTAVPDQDSPFGGQRNAAQFGQQPQLDLKLPSKDVVDMQQSQTDNGRGETMAQLASMPRQDENRPDESRVDAATLLREQSLRNDANIQNDMQNRIGFMDQASKMRGVGPNMDIQRNMDPSLGFVGHAQGKDSDNSPHGIPNSDSSSVSDKDIMKAEGIAPNEMHDLHNFLKTSNEFHGQNQGKFAAFDNPYSRSGYFQKNIAPSKEEQGVDTFRDNPHRHHSRKFMSNRKYSNDEDQRYAPSQENFERPNVNFFARGKEDTRESRYPMPTMKDREMMKAFKSRGGENMPSMSNLLEGMPPPPMGAVGGGSSNPDYVEQTARQLMQTNSDYKLPGTTFTNLWKSFMLTTQSQLGAADPSANSREGFLGVPKKDSSRSRWKKSRVGVRKHASQVHRKKSSVDNAQPIRNAVQEVRTKRSHTHKNFHAFPGKRISHKLNARLVYLPVSFLKSALSKAVQEIGAKKMRLLRTHNHSLTPEKELNVNGVNRQLQNIKNLMSNNFVKVKNAKLPAFFITEKDGKRYLVLDPNQNLGGGMPAAGNQFFSFAFPPNANMFFQQQHQQRFYNNFADECCGQPHFGPIGQKNLFEDNLFKDLDRVQSVLKIGKAKLVAVPVVPSNFLMRNQMRNPVGLPMINFSMQQQFVSPLNSIEMKSEFQPYPVHPPNADSMPNAFMYGPQFGQRDDQNGENVFEKISSAQPLFSGHFYRDPYYDPHVSEDSFPDTGMKNPYGHSARTNNADEIIGGAINTPAPIQVQDRNPMVVNYNSRPPPFFGGSPRINFQRPPDFNRGIALEPKLDSNEQMQSIPDDQLAPISDTQRFANEHPLFGAVPNPPMNSLYPQSPPRLSDFQSSEEEVNDPTPDESPSRQPSEDQFVYGTAPQPLPMEEFRNEMKKHTVPEDKEKPVAVFTKEHVGFGPITVEAKTANAPLTDPDDD